MDNSERQRRKKWQVAGLCWGALTMVSMIRIAMAVAAPTLMETYDISPPKTSVLSLAIPGPCERSIHSVPNRLAVARPFFPTIALAPASG